MAIKHGAPSSFLNNAGSPVHKKRRIFCRDNDSDGVTSTWHRRHPRPKPFTKADAKALHRQMQDFENEYKNEGYTTTRDTPPKDVDLTMTRGTLHLRHREIRDVLDRTFSAHPSRILHHSSRTYRLLAEYRAALARHRALWHHRRKVRRTLHTARALDQESARLAADEAAADADTERDFHDDKDPSCQRVRFDKRRKWYRTVKKDMRRRGQWISKEAPGPGIEWEPVDVHESPGARVRLFNPVAGDWILPSHVRSQDDLVVYLNQLGLRFTPPFRRPEAQPWA
ncbi:hypothetical protein CTA2_12305 [Colletotrichum tanaceti]|uniref:Uncharacterized protein n=1 Tax=Colletotrichum tanaceti TaxID=1306861 RepID=A0A4U6XDN2_9PEZI|nr:hypothetical protein CTA2_12305 [Colletotrichum tanaceti]TKW53888.1 hypothetical protein CTA1_9660 [Colletotrichum tanaceti]